MATLRHWVMRSLQHQQLHPRNSSSSSHHHSSNRPTVRMVLAHPALPLLTAQATTADRHWVVTVTPTAHHLQNAPSSTMAATAGQQRSLRQLLLMEVAAVGDMAGLRGALGAQVAVVLRLRGGWVSAALAAAMQALWVVLVHPRQPQLLGRSTTCMPGGR